jgi:biopolymer transport protein ExbB
MSNRDIQRRSQNSLLPSPLPDSGTTNRRWNTKWLPWLRHPDAARSGVQASATARVLLLIVALGGTIGVGTAFGQDKMVPEGGDAAVDNGEDSTGNTSTSKWRDKSMLDSIIEDGGICGFFIILCSLVSVGFMVEHALTIRQKVMMPEGIVDELDEQIRAGKIDGAIEICRAPENDCLATQVVLAGLERYQGSEFGFAEYKAAVEEAGEHQTGRLYRKTEVLALIGAIAPMLGLQGTVLGMIKAFNTIAARGGMARPDELAGGISEALVTTMMGLFVAIPTMIAFSYFRNKIDSLVAEVGKRVEQILMPLGRRKS